MQQVLALVCLGLLSLFIFFFRKTNSKAPPVVNRRLNFFEPFKELQNGIDNAVMKYYKTYGNIFTMDFFFLKITFLVGQAASKFLFKQPDDVWNFRMGGEKTTRLINGPKWNPKNDEELRLFATQTKLGLDAERDHFFEYIKELSINEFKRWETLGEFDLYNEADRLLAYVNIRCFIGEEVGSQRDRLKDLYKELENIGFSILALVFPLEILPFGPVKRTEYLREEILKIIRPIVQARRNDGKEHKDFLHQIMHWERKGHVNSPEEVVGFLLRTFFAARVNTLNLACRCISHLGKKENIVYAEALRKEIAEKGYNTLSDVNSIKSLDRIVWETLRLAFSGTVRWSLQEVELDGLTIPKHHLIFLSNRPVCFDETKFPEPERFNPDRWINQDTNIFFPFGNGAHRCKGEAFALQEVKTFLAFLFGNYEVNILATTEDNKREFQPGTKVVLKKLSV